MKAELVKAALLPIAVLLSVVFMYWAPAVSQRVVSTLRSASGRAVGMGVLHSAHFDVGVKPSRSVRRGMGLGRRGFFMLADETGAITFPELKKKTDELDAVKKELADVFEQARTESGTFDMSKVTSIDGDSDAKTAWIRERNEKAGVLTAELADLEMLKRSAEIAGESGTGESGALVSKDGKRFVDFLFESPAIKNKPAGGDGPTTQVQLPETRDLRSTRDQIKNALFTTGDGWAPESTRAPRIDYAAEEMPAVVDLVPMITTDQPLYKFMRETLFTNAAGETAEGGDYHEAALKLEEAEEAIRKLTVWIGVTDEQLEDVPGARAYVESRLRFMLEQRLDQRMLYGNPLATPKQLRGFHNTPGLNTQSAAGLAIPDAVLLASAKARVNGQAMTDGVVLHPYDFTRVRLQKTTDGIYIWGHPSQVGPATLWGMKVVESANEEEGAGLTGAFRSQSLLVVRRGVDVQITNSHDEDFVKGKQAIRADFRCALVTIRPGAFTEIDGIEQDPSI